MTEGGKEDTTNSTTIECGDVFQAFKNFTFHLLTKQL